jgi:hypothetical protein
MRPPVHGHACRLADGSVNDVERGRLVGREISRQWGPVKCAKDTAVENGLSMKYLPVIYQEISKLSPEIPEPKALAPADMY